MARDFSGGTTNPPHLKKVSASLGLSNGCSIACWFYSDLATGGPRYIAGWGNGTRILGLVQSGNRLGIGDKGSGSPIHGSATTGNAFAAGSWNHAVGIVAADNDRRVILNGDLDNKGTVNPSASFVASTDVWVGANIYELSGFANGFNGRVAWLGIYAEVLPDEAIVALSRGAHPALVRPHELRFLADLSGRHDPELERMRGAGLSLLNGPDPADGPRLFQPRRRLIFLRGSAGGADAIVAPSGAAATAAIGQAGVIVDGGYGPAGMVAAVTLGQTVAKAGSTHVIHLATGSIGSGLIGAPAPSWGARVSPIGVALASAAGSCRVRRGGWAAQPADARVWGVADAEEATWQLAPPGAAPWMPSTASPIAWNTTPPANRGWAP